ncbi:hypothetical protein RYX36_010884, partial [Vicia faba]
ITKRKRPNKDSMAKFRFSNRHFVTWHETRLEFRYKHRKPTTEKHNSTRFLTHLIADIKRRFDRESLVPVVEKITKRKRPNKDSMAKFRFSNRHFVTWHETRLEFRYKHRKPTTEKHNST